MNKKTLVIVVVLVVAFAALVGASILQKQSTGGVQTINYTLAEVEALQQKNDYSAVNLNTIIPASEMSGDMPENINGKADAPVVLYEYADYMCSGCAAMNPLLNKIVTDYDGKVAVVFRTYVLSYHGDSGVQAVAAANAAAKQGVWKAYKDKLFADQAAWFYSAKKKLQGQLEDYFMEVTSGAGDLAKFREDMASESVKKKIVFDQGVSEKVDLQYTPWIYVGDEWADNRQPDDKEKHLSPAEYAVKIREMIDAKLKK